MIPTNGCGDFECFKSFLDAFVTMGEVAEPEEFGATKEREPNQWPQCDLAENRPVELIDGCLQAGADDVRLFVQEVRFKNVPLFCVGHFAAGSASRVDSIERLEQLWRNYRGGFGMLAKLRGKVIVGVGVDTDSAIHITKSVGEIL